MTKYLIIILIAILLFVGAVVTFKDNVSSESSISQSTADAVSEETTKKDSPKVAELKSGVHLKAMDISTKAADDFYQYTNGGWLDNTEIPGMYSGYTVYHEVNERVEVALRKIIQQASDSVSEPGSESQKVGDLFRSYMDVEKINQIGVKAIDYELNIAKSITDTSSLTKVFCRV